MVQKKPLPRVVFIDGHALLHRAYHAYPLTLTTTKGELVNAVYGFAANLFSIVKTLKPEYVAVAFDLKGPTFRHKKFALYKASRVKPDEELINQIDRVKQVVRALNIPIFEVAGFEADDVIGTLARQAEQEKQPLEVVIATGDRDALQLIDERVKVFFPGRGDKPAKVVDEAQFKEEYGFEPERLVDYKALAGDASDDIPGVRGIGPKKATQLVRKFGTVEKLYQALEAGDQAEVSVKDAALLKQGKDQAFLSKDLATIITQTPINLKLQACKLTDYDEQEVRRLFEELEFRSLLNRLPGREEIETRSKNKELREKKTELKERQMELF
jgi:DNA polymerase-1